MIAARIRLLFYSASLLGVGACAAGADDAGNGLSGPYGGPADSPYGGSMGDEDSEGSDDGDPLPPGASAGGSGPVDDGGDTTGGGDDGDGNPLCCEVHPAAGCGSMATESCVCASKPSCCQTVWTQECVDLAVSCGDPYCAGDSGAPPDDSGGDPPPDDSGGDPPPDDSGGDPPPPPPPASCPCSGDPAVDNFCHYAPNTANCPMTQPGGYCDPNGDGSYDDGNWEMGYYDYLGACP